MKIKLLLVGKTEQSFIKEGCEEYEKRLKHYVQLETIVIQAIKKSTSLSFSEVKVKEAELILKNLTPSDFLVLLDERGKGMTSVDFSTFLNQRFSSGIKTVVFLVGGAYGVDESIKKRSQTSLSLSQMTFSHQMVRLFFLEQLYRAMTILNNESYHHE